MPAVRMELKSLGRSVARATWRKPPSNYDKRAPYSCSSERRCSPHRLSSCNGGGAYESSSRAEDGGLQPPDATRAICYFALSATRSLIKRPLLVVRPAFFKPATAYDMPLRRDRCTSPFFRPRFRASSAARRNPPSSRRARMLQDATRRIRE